MTPPAPPTRRRRLRRWAVRLLALSAVGAVLANVLGYLHAYRLTHYTSAADPPTPPERMSFGEKVGVALTGVPVPRPASAVTPDAVGLPYTAHVLDPNSVAVWRIDHPAARGVVVLGHGYSASKSSVLAEAAGFHRLGFACVLVDFRGSGDSPGSDTTLGVREAADLADTVGWVQKQFPGKPVVLYGVSMGAAAALKAVSAHGVRPAAVVLEAPFDRLANAVRVRVRATGFPSWPAAELVVFWGGVQHGFDGFAHDPADDAAAVTCPALVAHGGNDPRAPAEMADRVYDRLAGPKTRVAFPDAGHESFVKHDPARWEAEVGKFLAGVVK